MKQHAVLFFIILIVLSSLSCSIFFTSPLEICAWTTDDLTVSVMFNREPEHVRAEEAFSITANGIEPPGRISWDGAMLIFTAFTPLYDSVEYEIKVTTAAEDIYGNSLDEEFRVKFRTGDEGSRPEIMSVTPAEGAHVENQFQEIIIIFDQPVNFDSLLESFSISPDITGTSVLNSSSDIFTFAPTEAWDWQQKYTVEISTELKTVLGYRLSENFLSAFTVGTDEVSPQISTAASVDEAVILLESPSDNPAIQVNSGWEKDSPVRISFTEEIDHPSAESSVSIEPAVQLDISFDESRSPADMIIDFEDNLEWRKLYRIAISTALKDLQDNCLEKERIYYIFIDGSSSAPPKVKRVDLIPGVGVGFCLFDEDNPAAAEISHQILDTSGGDALQNPFFIDYYFNLAANAELPFFEFTDNFLISPASSCTAFTYLNFQLFNPGDAVDTAALPRPTPTADQAVLRLITSLSDSSTSSGTILFQIFSDLSDSLGNSMTEDWTAELFDEDN